MKFKIVGDSCCDFTKEERATGYFVSVPMILTVGTTDILDDENIVQEDFLKLMEGTPECPKSACPSPETFMKAFEGADDVYVVTLSAKISGAYNAAVLAREMFLEDHKDVNIHIFDSKSAAAGEHILCKKIEECVLKEMSYQNVVDTVEGYITRQSTIFVLDDLEVMMKNGRLSRIKGNLATLLSIKPVLYGKDGEIHQLDQARGMNKALNAMLRHVEKSDYSTEEIAEITCCDSIQRCKNVRMILMEKFGFKDVRILEAGGLSSMYESRGGVVLTYFNETPV